MTANSFSTSKLKVILPPMLKLLDDFFVRIELHSFSCLLVVLLVYTFLRSLLFSLNISQIFTSLLTSPILSVTLAEPDIRNYSQTKTTNKNRVQIKTLL